MKRVLIAATALALLTTARSENYDVIIRHGRVGNGSGNPAFFADVAVNR